MQQIADWLEKLGLGQTLSALPRIAIDIALLQRYVGRMNRPLCCDDLCQTRPWRGDETPVHDLGARSASNGGDNRGLDAVGRADLFPLILIHSSSPSATTSFLTD
jgi:hypothetical protein